MIIQDTLAASTAYIQAWLPGTTGGEAVVSSIFGDYYFRSGVTAQGYTNTLSVDWLSTEDSLQNYPVYGSGPELPSISNPLFKKGYGLPTGPRKPINPDNDDGDDNDFAAMLAMWAISFALIL